MILNYPFITFILSLIPTAIITIFILIKYGDKDIDKSLFFRMILFGAISIIPAVIAVSTATKYSGTGIFSRFLLKPFLSVALIEESVKIFIIRTLLYRNSNFNNIKDGIIYGIAIAIGFAFFENLIYMAGTGERLILIITRSFTAVPLHAVCGAFAGFYAADGKVNEKPQWKKALFSAVIIHGTYNAITVSPFPFNILNIIVVIISIVILKQLYMTNTHSG